MKHRIRSFFAIPPEIRPDFWQAAYQRNRLSVLVICIMIFGMELFNMARVLFWSSAGLGTLNNRIYFGLYCTLFLSAVLCLLLGFLLRGRSLRCQLAVQYGGVLFFLLWHVCLNAYDLFRDPQAEIGLYYTAVLGLSVFILMPAAPALLMHGSAYALLMALSGRIPLRRGQGQHHLHSHCGACDVPHQCPSPCHRHRPASGDQPDERKAPEPGPAGPADRPAQQICVPAVRGALPPQRRGRPAHRGSG